MENILKRVRQFSLKGAIVKWLISDRQFRDYIFNEVDEFTGEAISTVDDLKYDFENIEYRVDEAESTIERFEYETIDSITRDADDAIQTVKDSLMSKYVANIKFEIVQED